MLTRMRIDPVPANVIAIAACSLANFAASELVVFRAARVATGTALVLLLPFLATSRIDAAAAADMATAELTPATVAAWEHYEKQVDERYERAGSAGPDTFFAQDAFKTGSGWRQLITAGQVSMTRIGSPSPGQSEMTIPDGKVHHWAGAIFVRGAKVDAVVNRLKERAGRESESYADVVASKLLSRDGDRVRVFLKLKRDSIITVTYNTEHDVRYRSLGTKRASSRSVSTRIAELEHAGTAREREKPVGNDHGFLWRLNAYWRFEQVDEGVIIECESVSLSRGVPSLLRPFVTGTVERIARESLNNTLVSLRKELSR
jgi:hypothetical protein